MQSFRFFPIFCVAAILAYWVQPAKASVVSCISVPCGGPPAALPPGSNNVAIPIGADQGNSLLFYETFSFGVVGGSGPVGTLTEFAETGGGFGLGPTDILFAFALDVTGDNVASMVIPGFAGLQTSILGCGQNSTVCTISQGPVPTASRSANGSNITLTWGDLVGDSSIVAIYTNATSGYDPPMISIIDIDGNSSTITGFFAPTPLPATWIMMLIGLAGLGFAGYRQSKKAALPAAA